MSPCYLGILIEEYVETPGRPAEGERPEIKDKENRILRAKIPAKPAVPEVRAQRVHRVFLEMDVNRVMQRLNQSDQFRFYKVDCTVDSCKLVPVSMKRTGAVETREVVELEAGGESIAKAVL